MTSSTPVTPLRNRYRTSTLQVPGSIPERCNIGTKSNDSKKIQRVRHFKLMSSK